MGLEQPKKFLGPDELKNLDTYGGAERPDQLEMVENRKNTVAMELFKKIIEDLLHEEFTLQDIRDSYNSHTKEKDRQNKYGESSLQYLVDKEMLEYDEKSGVYSVNHNSPDVARIIETV